MRSRMDLVREWLDAAFAALTDNLKGLTLEEALFVPPGGYRSIIGTIKHAAGWSHVYRSYAFDAAPTHWAQLAWPHGLRDTVIKSEAYLADLIHWLELSHRLWQQDLLRTRVPEAQPRGLLIQDSDLDQLRPVHWRDRRPLAEIVRIIAGHHLYHAGEINQLLSIFRHEAWEEGEEVEENVIASDGHRVVPPWKR